MTLFLIGLAILIAGYFTYGKFVEKIFAPDDREPPAITLKDGVDFVPMPQWKNMLIQLLNIAGIGPVIGVIIGIKFGEIVFLLIPIGNIIGGAVHDMAAGMMSLRSKGANLPGLIEENCGKTFGNLFSLFMMICLMLVVAVFINVPSNLLDDMISGFTKCDPLQNCYFWYAVGGVFLYYIIATMFPVDKIIGNCYPIFGGLLLLGTLAIFVKLMIAGIADPSILQESAAFKAGKSTAPVLPMLFITIACGIISGFHATQSPIIARTMRSERQARSSFYGMMVLEGFIAMVWAAAALAVFNILPETMKLAAPVALGKIVDYFLGSWVGGITVLSVIILAVTSGDTALRSCRLSLSEKFHIDQKPLLKRFLVCLPMIVIVALLLWWSNQDAKSFNMLWNYFAWANQVIAVCTLVTATVYLNKQNKPTAITLIPGLFMLFITCTYLLSSKTLGAPVGLRVPLNISYIIAAAFACCAGVWAEMRGKKLAALQNSESAVPDKGR